MGEFLQSSDPRSLSDLVGSEILLHSHVEGSAGRLIEVLMDTPTAKGMK
jgi:hypothetical protein